MPSLKCAVDWLPATSRTKNAATPSKWAAEAALGDVYMTMAGWPLKRTELYAEAEKVLGDAIQNSGLKLATHYADLWKEANKKTEKEFLFGIMHSNANKEGKYTTASLTIRLTLLLRQVGLNYHASEKFYLAYPNDERKAHNFMTEWNTKKGVVNYKNSADKLPAISKYYDYNDGEPGKSAQSNGITCIYRYADILLMYAEASVRATELCKCKGYKCIAGSTETCSGSC